MNSGYRIHFMDRPLRQLRLLARRAQDRIRLAIEKLALNPRPAGVFALDPARQIYRLTVSPHRIVYRVDELHEEIVVLVIQEWPGKPRMTN